MSRIICGGTHWKQYAALGIIVLMFGVSTWASSRPAGPPFPQWDKVVHVISGAALAYTFLPFVKKSHRAISWMFAIGIIFEIMEVQFVQPFEYGGLAPYWLDTIGDLTAEAIGAIIFFWWLGVQRKHHG